MKLNRKGTIVLALITMLGTVGCKKKPEEVVIDPNKEVTVEWWNNYQVPDLTKTTEEAARKDKKYTEYYFALDTIKAFNVEHPNIHVNTSYHGSYGNIATDIKDGLKVGSIPTIASTYADNVAYYDAQHATFDMTKFAENLEADKDFNQNYLSVEKSVYGGKYLSLPYSKSTEAFVVNQTLFDLEGAGKAGTDTVDKNGSPVYVAPVAKDTKKKYAVPENFYDMIDVARTMKADFPEVFENQLDGDGYFTAVPFCWDSTENMFISLLQNAGIDYTKGTGKTLAEQLLWNSDKAKELVVELKKWNNEGLIATQNQLYITDAQNGYHAYSSDLVKNGKIFMSVSSTAGARYYANDGGFLSTLNHGLNWKKGSKAKDAKVISQGPSLTFFRNADEDVNKGAYIFYEFLTNSENSAKLASATSYFPVRESSNNSDVIKNFTSKAGTVTAESLYADKNAAYSGSALKLNEEYTANNNYFMSDAFETSSTSRTVVGNLINDVFKAKATTDEEIKKVVDDAFAAAWTNATK